MDDANPIYGVLILFAVWSAGYWWGRWRESMHWQYSHRLGRVVKGFNGIEYRPITTKEYLRLTTPRSADDAGCCCEAKDVPYKSVNEG